MDDVQESKSTMKTLSDPDASAKIKTDFQFRPISPSSFIIPSKNNTKSHSTSKSNRKSGDSLCFPFGKVKREVNQDSEKGFKFVFNDISPSSDTSELDFKVPRTPVFNFKLERDTGVMKDKSGNSNCLTRFNKYEETLTNLKDDQNNGKVENINRKNEEDSEGKDNLDESISLKTLFKEFKEIINEFVRERIEHEKRILALEEKVEILERKCAITNKYEMNISPVIPANGAPSMSLNKTTPANFLVGATTFPNLANQSSLSNQSFKSCTRMSHSSSLQDSSLLSDEANSPTFEIGSFSNAQKGLSPSRQRIATNTGRLSEVKDDRGGDSELSDLSTNIMKSLKLEDLREVIDSSIRQAIENNLSRFKSTVHE